jgi:glycosyltransferase involved in cell wall biosynthesis
MRPWIFLTSITPDWQGVGWNIRTAACLRAFSRTVPVHLVCLSLPHDPPPPENTTRFCAGVTRLVLPPGNPENMPAPWPLEPHEWSPPYPDHLRCDLLPFADELTALAGQLQAHTIVVRGMVSVGPLPYFLPSKPRIWLELDECSRKSLDSRSQALERTGFTEEADKVRAWSLGLGRLEEAALARCQVASVCSQVEWENIHAIAPGIPLHVLPNVQPDVLPLPPAPADEALRLLFVGNLFFPPNLDALLYFAHDILPAMRRISARTIFLCVAGNADSPQVPLLEQALLSHNCQLQFTGHLQDLAPLYENTDVCIAPIRSGGGTRMKIIQAFAHSRPVVATPFGAEGLEVEDGHELLLADNARAFAAACLRIKEEPDMAGRLAANARRRFEQSYSCEVLDGIVARLVHAPDNPTPSIAE